MLHKRIIPSVVLVLALAAPGTAFAEPVSSFLSDDEQTSSAAPAQDLRSPDVRDAAAGAIESSVPQDLRSPDVRDAAAGVVQSTPSQDLRSPDVRDVASGNLQPAEPVPAVQTPTSDDGFEWSSAAIGAAAMLAIVLALGAAAALVVPRRRMRSTITH